jgi:hypothetical protein
MVRDAGVAESAIEPYRPGGDENSGRDAFAWLKFWRQLQRLHARAQRDDGNGGGVESSADETLLLDAVRDAGKPVELVLQDENGEPRRLVVRQLSFEALMHLNARDRLVGVLARQAERLARATSSEDAETFQAVSDELAYQQAIAVWVSCGDTARLPFDPQKTPRPTPPDWARDVTPIDITRIVSAMHRVNGYALLALRRVIDPSDEPGARASWLTYFTSIGGEGDTPPVEFIRDRGLVGLIAGKAVAADTQKKAFDEAKRRAGAGDDS